MNIRIDDDVPLPQSDKPDTWVTGKPGAITEVGVASEWVTKVERTTYEPPLVIEAPSQRYPTETTYDAKGVPTVDCFLVGGPLNGKNGPIVGTAQVVELDIYAVDGSVASVELYELGDRKELGCRYWKGTKA